MPQASAASIDALSLVPAPSKAKIIPIRRAEQRRRERSKPPQERIEAMLERLSALRAEREQWRGQIMEAYELFLPQRDPFKDVRPGARKGRDVLDSTAQKAIKRWASRKQQQLMPPGKQFARVKAGISVPEGDRDQFREPLQQVTDIIFAYIAISNASTAVHESILDAGVSTGAFQVLDSGDAKSPLQYVSCNPAELLLDEGPWGSVENVYRERTLTFHVISRQWPDFDFHPDTLRRVEGAKPPAVDTKIELIEACVYNVAARAYDYCIIEKETKHCGWHEARDESPWVVYGDSKLTGETYRRGPALTALADARTLQRVKELVLRNAALAIAGLWKAVPSSEFDPWNLTLEAGGIVPVTSMDDIEPLEISGKFEISDLIIKDLQTAIMDVMETLQLGEVSDTAENTLGDLLIRQSEADQDRASSSARLQTELVLPFMRKTVYVLARRGLIPPIKVDGHDVDIEFEGPLAQAQNREKLIGVRQAMELTAPLGPAALVPIDAVKLAKHIYETSGVWADTIKTDAQIDAAQQQLAQVAAQAAQAQGIAIPQQPV